MWSEIRIKQKAFGLLSVANVGHGPSLGRKTVRPKSNFRDMGGRKTCNNPFTVAQTNEKKGFERHIMANADTLDDLFATILARKGTDPKSSYTASLLAKGPNKCAQKMGEEAIETVIAGVQQDRGNLVSESADLIYHLWVLLAASDVTPAEVYAELDRRTGQSGHEEKASR